MTWEVIHGDCLEPMRVMAPESVDAVITDPPYGLKFMGKDWDHGIPGMAFWEAMLRVAKPGAHLLAFGGTRTHHRLMCAIEDAGWEIRDCLMWVYGSGFPKSLDVGRAIDKAAGAERQVVGQSPRHGGGINHVYGEGMGDGRVPNITAPATDAAKQWDGWGTALKPAWEPIILARKPLVGTVAANVLEYGTGGLNIDGCRVVGEPPRVPQPLLNPGNQLRAGFGYAERGRSGELSGESGQGRWPANFIHDGSEEVVGLFPQSGSNSGVVKTAGPGAQPFNPERGWNSHSMTRDGATAPEDYGDSGSAARFFYCAKASKSERGEGNTHPTVKPLALLRWLCRLVTPPNGLVLDPFTGSGTTGCAAELEGFRFAGIENVAEYVEIARKRISEAAAQTKLFCS